MNADVILFQETSLQCDDTGHYMLPHHPSSIHIKIGKGKGISIFSKRKLQQTQCKRNPTMQMLKVAFNDINIINVYRSSDCGQEHFCSNMVDLINEDSSCVVLGDFNICSRLQSKSTLSKCFSNNGFHQIVREATHIQGRIIDHVYCREKNSYRILDLERYSPYYSDHDALLLSITTTTTNG